MTLEARPKARYFAKILAPNYDTDFYLLGWTPATYDAHNVLYTLIAGRANGRGEVNVGGYRDAGLDSLIDRIGVETDQPRRNALIREAGEVVRRDLPVIPLPPAGARLGVETDHRPRAAGGRLFPVPLRQGEVIPARPKEERCADASLSPSSPGLTGDLPRHGAGSGPPVEPGDDGERGMTGRGGRR